MESSQTRDGTCMPCAGRQNHSTITVPMCGSATILYTSDYWTLTLFFPKYFLLLTNFMDHCVKYICICVLLNVLVQIALWDAFIFEFPKVSKESLAHGGHNKLGWINAWSIEKSLPLSLIFLLLFWDLSGRSVDSLGTMGRAQVRGRTGAK